MSGSGNSYDYGFRIYNPRLGRFLSVDPLTKDYPFYTPYQFSGNKPIWAKDLDGKEEFFATDFYDLAGQLYKTEITIITNLDLGGKFNTMQKVHRSEVRLTPTGATVLYTGSTVGAAGSGVSAFKNATEEGLAMGTMGTLVNGVVSEVFSPNGTTEPGGAGFNKTSARNGVVDGTTDGGNTIVLSYGVAPPLTEPALPTGINAVPKDPAARVIAGTTNAAKGTETPMAIGNPTNVRAVNNVQTTIQKAANVPGTQTVVIDGSLNAPTPNASVPTSATQTSGNANSGGNSGCVASF